MASHFLQEQSQSSKKCILGSSESSGGLGVHPLSLELQCGSYWLLNQSSTKLKVKTLLEFGGAFLVLLESPWWVRFSGVYFTIFRAKVWKILIFEWILFLNYYFFKCEIWVWKVKLGFKIFILKRPRVLSFGKGFGCFCFYKIFYSQCVPQDLPNSTYPICFAQSCALSPTEMGQRGRHFTFQ